MVLEVIGKFHDVKHSWIDGESFTSDDSLDLFIKLSSSTGNHRFKPVFEFAYPHLLEFGSGD